MEETMPEEAEKIELELPEGEVDIHAADVDDSIKGEVLAPVVEPVKEELDEISASVQKRIDKLTYKMREAERQRDEAVNYAQSITQNNSQLKEKLKNYLDKKKITYEDVGTYSLKSVDYPDYAKKVAKKVVKKKDTLGILVCGTGTGMAIAANKIKGARATVAYDNYSAKMSRIDNNSNILALRDRNFPYKKTQMIVNTWINSKFSGKSRHKRRIKKIE